MAVNTSQQYKTFPAVVPLPSCGEGVAPADKTRTIIHEFSNDTGAVWVIQQADITSLFAEDVQELKNVQIINSATKITSVNKGGVTIELKKAGENIGVVGSDIEGLEISLKDGGQATVVAVAAIA